MRYRATLAYEGTAYAGWQLQLNQPTIQGEINRVLQLLEGAPVMADAAGRTDAGVHAAGQVIAFRLCREWPSDGLLRAINGNLPRDIRVLDVEAVTDAFHPRFDARRKMYRYRIVPARVMTPFWRRYALHYPYDLDYDRLIREAGQFVGCHDFRGFTVSDCDVSSTVRTIEAVDVQREGEMLRIDFTGDGFLRYQVRNMVGALLEINLDRRRRYAREGIGSIDDLIRTGERGHIGIAAPAHGLTLMKVEY